MQLIEVELLNNTNKMVDAYLKAFRDLYGQTPDITDDDRSAVRKLFQRIKIRSKTEIDDLATRYVTLQDDWLRGQGFPLRFIESRYNAIMASGGAKKEKTEGLKTEIPFFCDGCGERFLAVTPLNYKWSTRTLCETCRT